MENENKPLLERAKDAVKGAAEGLAENAQKALHKLEEIAPAPVAARVHAVAEAASQLLPHPAAETPAAPKISKPNTPPAKQKAAATQASVTTLPRAVKTPAEPAAKPKFKIKRGQKH